MTFISIEGGEGGGKGTQIGTVEKWFLDRGREVVLTREPGGSRIGLELRKILLHLDNADLSPLAELYLYLADRAQHVAEVVRPALDRGAVVISDRFLDSTVAYQGAGRAVLSRDETVAACLTATGGLVPDMTLLLDVDPAIGLSRAKGRNLCDGKDVTEGRFEAEALGFHRAVRDGFLDLARVFPDRFRVVDASRSVDEVSLAVEAALEKRFGAA